MNEVLASTSIRSDQSGVVLLGALIHSSSRGVDEGVKLEVSEVRDPDPIAGKYCSILGVGKRHYQETLTPAPLILAAVVPGRYCVMELSPGL